MKKPIDIDAILTPIAADNPAGEDLRYSPIYHEISEARREDDTLDRGDWQRKLKKADWDRVIELCVEALREKTIYIDENPIVGTITRYRCGLWPMADWSCRWMRKEAKQRFQLGELDINQDLDEKDWLLLNQAVDYWQTRCVNNITNRTFTEVTGINAAEQLFKPGAISQGVPHFPLGLIILDYGKVISNGMSAIIAEAEEKLASLPLERYESFAKRDFYKAALICLKASVSFAHRYAGLARTMASAEPSLERKKLLEEIAETYLRFSWSKPSAK